MQHAVSKNLIFDLRELRNRTFSVLPKCFVCAKLSYQIYFIQISLLELSSYFFIAMYPHL